MTSEQANKIITQIIARGLSTLPPDERIQAYEALAVRMPTEKQRTTADRIAWTLTEIKQMELEFFTDIFEEFGWPGHQHNGPHAGGDQP